MRSLWREVSINGALFLLLTLVASAVAYWALRLIVDRPLSHLMHSIKAAESGEKRPLIDWTSGDEMGSVVSAYNSMIEQSDEHTAQLVRAREEAELAGASKTRFLANMSHELRTPLNAVIGITEMLREEAQDKKEDTEPFDRVTGAGRHLLGLIDNILDFSKIDADRIQLVKEEVSVQQLMNELDRTASALAKQNGNEFSSSFGDVPAVITADTVRLRQVLINLIGNACKFTKNGNVTLSVERASQASNANIRFTVSDTGIGIDPEKIPNLFADFSQADPGIARQFGGTGLGLAISQRLCQMMGSEISVTSELGKGSSFSFVIPTTG
jgi:signal transduction histidine kinase